MTKRFLVVDGYPKESREQFKQVGMTLAGQLYADLLKKYLPEAEYDLWYSSDPGVPKVSDEQLSDYAGILWPGCNLTIYHDDPRVHAHLELAARAYEAGVPGFGSCWAIQVAAKVAGGEVAAHPKGREMGIATKIRLTDEAKQHPMFEGKPEVYSHFVSHDDEVTRLPAGATRLAGNDWSRVQAIAVKHKQGVFWATQYHPEYNLHEMARLIVAREPRLVKQGLFRDHDDLMAYVDKLETLYEHPDRTDLRWQLKIDDDILSDDIRECEFRNWIKHVIRNTSTKKN
ncbi:MAG: type 1 glutamine amidotransferase [Candidatus Hydrogenedentes bacterium]|nr:type 1 glutamine amidotransferase [Candidatus Hydrogenedentota bacterium]